ncbi:MAG: Uma2 family endonuclease [Lachnospiraceae bacterium]|nr:Uma2 family endonuclease [Lachnospiraceae bacterium]
MKEQEKKNSFKAKGEADTPGIPNAPEKPCSEERNAPGIPNVPEKPCSYEEEGDGSNGELLCEAKMKYVYSAYKRQGEYTLEDYYALPDDRRTELIDGYFYDMAAPYTTHQIAGFEISVQLANFIKSRKGLCRVLNAPVDVQLDCDDRTMVQPDVLVVCDRDKIKKRCVYGAPDFVIEILSDATARKDLTVKLWKYMSAGVREYWIVDLRQEKVIVYDRTEEDGMLKNKADENRAGNNWHISIYGMDQPVPVRIFGGECQIRFDEICEEVRPILEW